MERVGFIVHKGKRVLFADCRNAGPEEMKEIAEQVVETVTAQPRGSVLIVADYTGTKINKETAQRLKEAAAQDMPYVKRAAWVGTEEAIPPALFRGIETFSTRKLMPFKTRDEALDWIVEEEAAETPRAVGQ